MVGCFDDWFKIVVECDCFFIDFGYLEWVGIVVIKCVNQIFVECGFYFWVLCVVFCNVLQWFEFIGGDFVVFLLFKW